MGIAATQRRFCLKNRLVMHTPGTKSLKNLEDKIVVFLRSDGYKLFMAKRAQTEFQTSGFEKQKDCFGGSLLKGNNPKIKRPLESKMPIHLVLRSNKGVLRLPASISMVKRIIVQTNKRHGVTMYGYANVGNHLHMVIKIPARTRWSAYIRELTGRMAQAIQRLKGPAKAAGAFWKERPFTRIVRGWQNAFRRVLEYVELNFLEAEGFISRKQTKTLKDLRSIFDDG